MINKDRIVPVQRTDLLTLYGTILKLASVSATVLPAKDVEGAFEVDENGTYICAQPVKSIEFAAEVTDATVYCVFDPAFDFEALGFENIVCDSAALYTIGNSSGTLTATAISPVL